MFKIAKTLKFGRPMQITEHTDDDEKWKLETNTNTESILKSNMAAFCFKKAEVGISQP